MSEWPSVQADNRKFVNEVRIVVDDDEDDDDDDDDDDDATMNEEQLKGKPHSK